MNLQLQENTNNDSIITYEGFFAGIVDIRVEVGTDDNHTIQVYANDNHVGALVSYEVSERISNDGISFDDIISEFLQLANVGR